MINTKQIKIGQKIQVTYENRTFELIVIDPNGLGDGQPSLGFGLNMMEKYAGLPQSTASGWIKEGNRKNGEKLLETPTGNTFRVIERNDYVLLEISDWVAVAEEALKAKGFDKG